MKKTIICLLICSLISSLISGQTTLPVDTETGKITFSEVVKVDSSLTKNALYLNAQKWLTKAFKDANAAIQFEDKEEGKVIAKGTDEVRFKQGMQIGDQSGGDFMFTLTITVKDGRYKYTITDISHTGNKVVGFPKDGGAIELESPACGKWGMGDKLWLELKGKFHDHIKSLIESLKDGMTQKPGKDADDW